MLKQDAIEYFGSKSKLASAAGVSRSAVSLWGELIPEVRAARIQAATGGALVYNPAVYDQNKQARKEALNHENQSDD